MLPAQTRYSCSICQQTFSRNEHLLRHQVKHAAVRAFKCKTCLQSFSRSDALKRHESIHQPLDEHLQSTNTSGTLPKKRKTRASAACDRCANAKIRCNGKIPCDPCLAKYKVCTLERPHTALRRRCPLPSPPALDLPFDGGEISQNEFPTSEGPANQGSHLASPTIDSAMMCSDDQALSQPIQNHNESFQNMSSESSQALDLLDKSVPSLWNDVSTPFYAQSPFRGESFAQFFWFPEEASLAQSVEEHINRQSGGTFTRNCTLSGGTIDPYASHPHVHHPKKGPIVKVVYICDFLHDTNSWNRINELERNVTDTTQKFPVILDGIRDTLSARVHVMLSKALDQDMIRKIPHLFPPLETINALFREYYRRCAYLYPVVHPSTFFESTWASDEAYLDLGLFLSALLALGSLTTPVPEVQLFAVELAFLIRNMINETMTRDEHQMNDMWTMGTALLMTVFSAWCGNKRHAELAEAFRGTFSTAFLRRGYFKSCSLPDPADQTSIYQSWKSWIDWEQETRFGYIWYIIEQEISLFHCLSPTIHFTDMRRPMPAPDEVFFARTEEEWTDLLQKFGRDGNLLKKVRPPSLASFYSQFLRHDFLYQQIEVTPLQLRLLLCTIQTQVTQFSQSNRFISTEELEIDYNSFTSGSGIVSLRQEELQTLLLKWHVLRQRVLGHEITSEMALACKLIYHLVWVELLICFNDIQLIAGREGHSGGKALFPQLQRWARSSSAPKALAHIGQIMRLFQNRDNNVFRPIWWPVALSRVALIMWAYAVGVGIQDRTPSLNDIRTAEWNSVPLNDNSEDFDSNGRVIQPGEGTPCIRDNADSLIPLYQYPEILDLCIDILEEGRLQSSPICISMQQFLRDMKGYEIPWMDFDSSLES